MKLYHARPATTQRHCLLLQPATGVFHRKRGVRGKTVDGWCAAPAPAKRPLCAPQTCSATRWVRLTLQRQAGACSLYSSCRPALKSSLSLSPIVLTYHLPPPTYHAESPPCTHWHFTPIKPKMNQTQKEATNKDECQHQSNPPCSPSAVHVFWLGDSCKQGLSKQGLNPACSGPASAQRHSTICTRPAQPRARFRQACPHALT